MFNKPAPWFFFFYLILVSFSPKQPHTPVVHRIVYYKRLYIFFSINIYVQMEGGQEETIFTRNIEAKYKKLAANAPV